MLVVVINTDGTVEGREIDGTLASMQAIVGGLIQPLDLTETETLWANEEGLLLDLPYNHVATELLRQWYQGLSLCGTIFLTGGTDDDGNILPATQEHVDALTSLAESFARLDAL